MHSQHCGSLQIELHNVQMSLRCSRLYFIFVVYMLHFFPSNFTRSLSPFCATTTTTTTHAKRSAIFTFILQTTNCTIAYPAHRSHAHPHTHTVSVNVLAQVMVGGGWGAHKCFAGRVTVQRRRWEAFIFGRVCGFVLIPKSNLVL